jgi:hypothetical protein
MVKTSRVRIVTILGLALVAWLGAHAAVGQSLGEVARREAERRKAVAGPVKVYKNDSVRPAPAPESPPAASTPEAAPAQQPRPGGAQAAADEAGQGAPAAKDPKDDPEYWRKRMTDLQSQRDRNAFVMEAVQSRINALWADFTARDDPAQRAVIASDRQRALAELERMKKDQESFDKQIADLQEEARRANIPPGWIR